MPMSCLLIARRQGFQRLAIGHRDPYVEAARPAVLERVVDDTYLVAGLQRVQAPAAPAKPTRAHALQAPLLHPALLAGHGDPDERVRLRPFISLDRAAQRLLRTPFEHGGR